MDETELAELAAESQAMGLYDAPQDSPSSAAALEAEVRRLQGIIRDGIAESVAKAPMRFRDGGIDIEHFAARALAASFADTLGDAPNCVELTVTPEGGPALLVTIRRQAGKSPLELKSEADAARIAAEARATKLEVELAKPCRCRTRGW